MVVARNIKWFNFGLCDAKQRSTPDICVNVEFIARRQNICTLKISERNAVGLLAVTNMATGRNLYIYFFREIGAEDDIWVWLGGKKLYIEGINVACTAHRDAVGLGTALQAGRLRVRFPMLSLDFFIRHNPSGRTMALGLTQPLTEMSTRFISWG